MKGRNEARRRLTLASAMLLFLCLMTGSVLAGYLVSIADADKNCINLNGSRGKGPLLTMSSNLSAGAARKLGFQVVGNDDDVVWSTDTRVDIFSLSYDKESDRVTVKSETSDKVLAPGTENDYRFSLKNTTSAKVDYSMWVEAKVEPENIELPVNVRMSGGDGKWLLGSAGDWNKPLDLNSVKDEGTLRRGESSAYTLSWQWPFEQENDGLDTLLGNQAVDEDLNFMIIIHTLATGTDSGTSHGDNGDDDNGRETTGTKPSENISENETETTRSHEPTAADEMTSGSDDNNGTVIRPFDDGSGNKNDQNRNDHNNNGSDNRNNWNGTGGSTDENGNGENSGSDNSGKDLIKETGSSETTSSETIKSYESSETGSTGAETGRRFPWWLGLLLLPLLLLLAWRRRIYVTGFVSGMMGSDMNWGRKKDQIRPDGRFVFGSMPFGTHTFTVTNPDSTEKASIRWRLKRDNDITGVRIEKQDGEYTVYAGKLVRAVELYFDMESGEINLRRTTWAAIDSDKNVYTPTGMIPPADDGTNITPGGLRVDENKKFDF